MSKYGNVVEYAEPWYVASTQGAANDPEIASQGYLLLIKADKAWELYTGDSSVVIGVSDNGVSQTHEDLGPNIAPNRAEIPSNGIDDDQNGYVDDYIGCNFASALDNTPPGNTFNSSNAGHGTMVAGLAGAGANNGIGILGLGFKSRFFPMKTAAVGSDGIIFGYQSLIYSAQRGFKVVNASWGIVKPASPIDQSVIDYCVANDVLVVASAGNHGSGTGGAGWLTLNYPSAYNGVLGVGETDESDQVQYTSGLGLNAGVMAPGRDAYTTDVSGGYTGFNVRGTSFASPMVAGLAALVRGKYPQLTALQTAAHIRRTADDITFKNVDYAQIVPGRINMLRALETEPLSAPAVRIELVHKQSYNGRIADRFFPGDTLYVTMDLVNDLGPVSDLATRLVVAEENGWTVQIIRDTATIRSIGTGEMKTTTAYLIVVETISADRPLILSLEMTSGTYANRALWYLNRPSFMTTFENNRLIYSMGDDGTVGFNSILTSRQGLGFSWKQGFSLISPSGFVLTESGSRSLSAYASNAPYISDFSTVKPFSAPQENSNIMTDDMKAADNKIGVRVTQSCSFTTMDVDATVFHVRVQNTAGQDLSDVSSGYFLDWDIGTGGAGNASRLAPEAIPDNIRGPNAAAQVFTRANYNVAICQAVYSPSPSGVAQSAVEPFSERVDDGDGLSTADIVALLSSGTTIQTTVKADLCSVLGVRYPGQLASGSSHSYVVVIGVGLTEAEATLVVRQTLTAATTVLDGAYPVRILIAPQPVSDWLTILNTADVTFVEVLDITGRVVLSSTFNAGDQVVLNTSALPSGAYGVRMQKGESRILQTVLVMR